MSFRITLWGSGKRNRKSLMRSGAHVLWRTFLLLWQKKLWAHCRLLEELRDLMERSLGALQNRVSISSDVYAKAKNTWRLGADKFTILLVGLQHFWFVALRIHYVCYISPNQITKMVVRQTCSLSWKIKWSLTITKEPDKDVQKHTP